MINLLALCVIITFFRWQQVCCPLWSLLLLVADCTLQPIGLLVGGEVQHSLTLAYHKNIASGVYINPPRQHIKKKKITLRSRLAGFAPLVFSGNARFV